MAKTKPAPLVRIKSAAWFRHDGKQVCPGDVIEVSPTDADDLVAVGFALRVEG